MDYISSIYVKRARWLSRYGLEMDGFEVDTLVLVDLPDRVAAQVEDLAESQFLEQQGVLLGDQGYLRFLGDKRPDAASPAIIARLSGRRCYAGLDERCAR